MDLTQAMLKAEAVIAALEDEIAFVPLAEAAQLLHDGAHTVVLLLSPFVSMAEVTAAEEEDLDLALRARAALPEDPDL